MPNSLSQALFNPPLPDTVQSILLGCRYLAFGVAFPIIFLMLLDASAYVVFRTLGVYARRVRVVDNSDINTASPTPIDSPSATFKQAISSSDNTPATRSNLNKHCLKTLASNLANTRHAASVPLPNDSDKDLRYRQPLAAA